MSATRFLRAAAVAVFALAGLAALRPAAAVEVQRVVSPGGIEAWLVEDHGNPIISLDLAFRGGSAAEPAAKGGLATLVASTLDEGAGELDSQAFQKALSDHSIGLSFQAGRDSFGGSLSTLTRYSDEAFDLLRLALTAPRFDAAPVERVRGQLQASLARQDQDPDAIAGRTLAHTLFGEHPYGRPAGGTAESLAAIGIDDLRTFARERLTRDRLVIGVAGDIGPERLAELLDSTFGALPVSGPALEVADVTPRAEGGVMVIERQQPQSVVSIAQPGISRDDPDFYAAYLVNYVLGGGGFASRLYAEVREKRGLAYSVYSYLAPYDHTALISAGVATQNARVGESLEVIREEWRKMAENGPTAEELADAKTFVTGNFPLRLTSTGKVSGILVTMQLDHLGIDYIDRRSALFDAVTLEDARRVARRLYDPAALTVVIVGQPEGVTATLPAPDAG